MPGRSGSDDRLWNMLESELGSIEDIRDLQNYLNGESEHYDMGYGALFVEPYEGDGGRSRMFRVRHDEFGEEVVSHSALGSVLDDLIHRRRKHRSGVNRPSQE